MQRLKVREVDACEGERPSGQSGMTRMLDEQRDKYFYLTQMNENYAHPELPAGVAEGVICSVYLLNSAGKPKKGELRV